MNLASFLPYLLAAGEVDQSKWLKPLDFTLWFAKLPYGLPAILVILVAIVAPFALGWLWAKSLRMPKYGWRIGLILCSVVASFVTIALGWPPRLGVDLKGGYIMIWQIEETNEPSAQKARNASLNSTGETSNRAALIEKLKQRLNPDGLKELSIRPYGTSEIEIIVPETDKAEIEKLKRQIQEQGMMEFLILAERNPDAKLFDIARAQSEDPIKRRQRAVTKKNAEGEDVEIGRWAKVGRDEKSKGGVRPLRLSGSWNSLLVRNAATAELLDGSKLPAGDVQAAKYLANQKIEDVEVLMKVGDRRVTGSDLSQGGLSSQLDDRGYPSVHFTFKPASAANMGALTGSNVNRQLAIVLDDTLLSAANIQSQITDRGQITGRFSQPEVDFVIRILKAGSLPARLKKNPVYEDPSDPTLGAENIRQGAWAVFGSLGLVFAFCLVYYRYAGVVACFALALNILMTLAVMILFGATLTMPGLAGMVLTVGMSVDANVLIFERIREELAKGTSLRMAIRNGYDRAMSTIIDSNLTTLLTAIILYLIGTDQLVGFAVTLTLGIVISMFTAIFCTRVVFEIWDQTGFVKTLSFMQFLTKTNFDFVRYMGVCVTVSCVLIGIGLIAAAYRGGGIYDIDLRGGTSIQVALDEPMSKAEMDKFVAAAFKDADHEGSRVDATVKPVSASAVGDKYTSFRIDSIYPEKEKVQNLLAKHLVDDKGQSLLKHYRVSYDVKDAQGAMLPGDESLFFASHQAAGATPETKTDETKPAEETKAADETKPDEVAKTTDETKPAEAAKTADEAQPANEPKTGDEVKPVETPKTTTAEPSKPQLVTTTLKFTDSKGIAEGIDQEAVKTRVLKAAKDLKMDTLQVAVDHPEWDRDQASRRSEWQVTITAAASDAQKILAQLQKEIYDETVWPSSKTIGGQIAADFVRIAIFALIGSIVGIIAYIWFRFQNVTWGFAAVLALVHDVLFMFAGIAVSYWLVGLPSFLQLTEFKIDLTVIAAFLTLIGYSINDTIVIFDRMREIKGKLPNVNRQIVNDSINQTLSRSILTFLTTFMVVVILYFFGGPGVHGFAFSMLIGTFVGMYSTVFIAAPFLLWMLEREKAAKLI